ncbi:MAG TPA: 30S ribosomal protein S18 [Planctomycetota bacterium]|jgi:small subunit ribosomal protein S18|nr:30S ribosomal protein S18 [Planctomycetota bacterium]
MALSNRKLKEKNKRRTKFKKFAERTRCRWTLNKKENRDKVDVIDYKNVDLLQKLVTSQGKMYSRKRAQASPRAQQRIKSAIKRARYMALLSYTG